MDSKPSVITVNRIYYSKLNIVQSHCTEPFSNDLKPFSGNIFDRDPEGVHDLVRQFLTDSVAFEAKRLEELQRKLPYHRLSGVNRMVGLKILGSITTGDTGEVVALENLQPLSLPPRISELFRVSYLTLSKTHRPAGEGSSRRKLAALPRNPYWAMQIGLSVRRSSALTLSLAIGRVKVARSLNALVGNHGVGATEGTRCPSGVGATVDVRESDSFRGAAEDALQSLPGKLPSHRHARNPGVRVRHQHAGSVRNQP